MPRSCLDDNTMLAFLEGDLPPEGRRAVEEHIDACDGCRRLLSRLADAGADGPSLSPATAPGEVDSVAPTHQWIPGPSSPRPRADGRAHLRGAASGPDGTTLIPDGTMVDHYCVGSLVGRGGMGEVYRARDTTLGRRVALKLIRPQLHGSKSAFDRFLFEARATARFNHPNIVAIYGVGEHQGRPYVALEFVEGETLSKRLKREPPEPDEGLSIGLGVARALAEAHRHRILHRDLKPGNIMLAPDGRPRVLDFGLAARSKRASPVVEWTMITEVGAEGTTVSGETVGALGTPRYMAPEQWLEEFATEKTDVWALGLILHELVTGRHPFAETPAAELPSLVTAERLPPLTISGPASSRAVMQLIERCLARDPSRRPLAWEVVGELERLTGDAATRGARQRHRRWALGGAAAATVVGAAAVVLALMWRAPTAVTGSLVDAAVATTSERSSPPLTPRSVDAGAVSRRHGATAPPRRVARPQRRPPRRERRSPERPSAPRTTPEVGHGRVIVQSVHAGAPMWADVYLDGRRRGRTPLTLERVTEGRHRVQVKRPGFASAARSVVVRKSQAVHVSLTLRRP